MNHSNGNLIWKRLKPLVQGFILYYPNTNATAAVIEKVTKSVTFSFVAMINVDFNSRHIDCTQGMK